MIRLYSFITYVLLPFILINFFLRLIKDKEDRKRYQERFGKANYNLKLNKRIIWLHAASVGEFKSSDLIIDKFHKDFQILITTTTKTSADYIKKYYKNKVIHQYIPFDVSFWCARFLNYWKPSLVLWIESDIWPNMLKNIKDQNINSLYINARISPKSFEKWKNLRSLYSESISSFNKIFVQSQDDLKRIEKLSKTKVDYIGNLKLSNHKKNIIIPNVKKIYSLMIVSSHKTEEDKILSNLKNIIKSKKLKICIAPRHLNRISEISKILLKHNLSFSFVSKENKINSDVTIIDSYGNLESYFNRSNIAILGGSFINKGGHNPLEPAKFGCAIISGNKVYNWQNIYDQMAKEKACIIVDDIKDLKFSISRLILDKNLLENFKKKALDFSNKKFFDKEALFKEIDLVLN